LARARVTGFPWDLLGTTQVNNAMMSPFIAMKAGAYGISFVIAAVNACLVAVLVDRHRRTAFYAVAAIAFATAFTAGELVVRAPLVATHTAVLVQQNLPLNIEWSPQLFDETMGELSDLSRQAAKKDDPAPRLIIWPESPGPFFVMDPKFRAWMGTLAQD